MSHFAFPNVDIDTKNPEQSRFIGCGRYAVFTETPPEKKYAPFISTIVNKERVEKAVSALLYINSETTKQVYEIKDKRGKGYRYVGESLHFAYLCARIACFRGLKLSVPTDIWCTGSIAIPDQKHPSLHEVASEEFTTKLFAFLAEANPDKLFLVPDANINGEHKTLCKKHNVIIYPLTSFKEEYAQEELMKKTIVTIRSDELPLLVSVVFQLGENPYKGLQTFTSQDADLFFGRNELTEKLYQKCLTLGTTPSATRLLAILGHSGSGKSSVLQAGLLPRLYEKPFSQDARPFCILFHPGNDPLTALTKSVEDAIARLYKKSENIQGIREWANNFSKQLKSKGKKQQWNQVAQIASTLKQSHNISPLVLLVDQFEELYAPDVNAKEREIFVQNLLYAARDQETRSLVIFTLRDDYRKNLDPHLNNMISADENHALVAQMTRTELRSAIDEPAKKSGFHFEQETLDFIIQQVEEPQGSLPLLEVALEELWNHLEGTETPETIKDILKKIGGVGGALTQRVQHLYATLPLDEQTLARRVFLDLVRPDDKGVYVRKPAIRVSQIAAYGQQPESVLNILRRFSGQKARFITLSLPPNSQEDNVELTHDTLIERWETLHQWTKEDDEFRTWLESLDVARQQWEDYDQDEGTLLQGARLHIAQSWLEEREQDLLKEQRDFIEASIRLSEKKKAEHEVQRQRELKRTRRFSAIIAIVAVLALGAAGWATWNSVVAMRERTKAEEKEIKALIQTSKTLFLSQNELESLISGIKAGIKAQKINLPSEAKAQIIFNLAEIIGHLDDVNSIHEQNRLEGHSQFITCVDFSSDGSLLASGSSDKTIKLWNALDGREIMTLSESDEVYSVNFSPIENILASGSRGTITLWDLDTYRKIRTLHIGDYFNLVSTMAFSPDGKILASGASNIQMIQLWNVVTGQKMLTLPECGNFVNFSSDGKLLASSEGFDKTISLWNVATGNKILTLKGHSEFVESAIFSPDGRFLASASRDKMIKLWDTATGEELRTFKGHSGYVYCVAFSPDGRTLVSGGGDNTIKLWSVLDGHEIASIHEESLISSVKFSPDGRKLASVDGRLLKLWKTNVVMDETSVFSELVQSNENTLKAKPEQLMELAPNSKSRLASLLSKALYQDATVVILDALNELQTGSRNVYKVRFTSDSKMLISANNDIIKIWDVIDEKIINILDVDKEGGVTRNNPNFSRDGYWSALFRQKRLTIFDSVKGEIFNTFPCKPFSTSITSISFSCDRKMLALGTFAGEIMLWDVATGKEITTLKGQNQYGSVRDMEFSPDDQLLASEHWDNIIKIWDVKNGQEVKTLPGSSHIVKFSPDGEILASGSSNLIKLWNVSRGMEILTLKGHSGYVSDLDFNADGTTLISGSSDKTIRIWDSKSGKELAVFTQESGYGEGVAFSPDDKMVAFGNLDGTVNFWSINLDDLLERGCKWLYGYLKNNSNVNDEDRVLCDDILKSYETH